MPAKTNQPLNILLVGGGGREHALARRIVGSPLTRKLFAAPGNPGIAEIAECVAIAADDVGAIVAFAAANAIDFAIVGPEGPLVAGLADRLAERGVPTFGPGAAASALEGSKSFMKDIAAKSGIPTAAYASFTDSGAAKAYAARLGAPIVVKADGLAAGKGVTVAADPRGGGTPRSTPRCCDGRFGAAGREIVIEEFLPGEEVSYFALVDGDTVMPLGAAQDHKAVGDGDTGPNTGGMGAYGPAPVVTPQLERRILDEIVQPLARAMVEEGRPYRGILFAGLMIVSGPDRAAPWLIEINVRFGDPECQVLMARLESDPVRLMLATAEGRLAAEPPPVWRDGAALAVVLCANGYPGTLRNRQRDSRVSTRPPASRPSTVLQAGTRRDAAKGASLPRAAGCSISLRRAPMSRRPRQRAYRAVDLIDWPGGFCRRDIGWRAIAVAERSAT